jgi:small subunit ribosomal protein S1
MTEETKTQSLETEETAVQTPAETTEAVEAAAASADSAENEAVSEQTEGASDEPQDGGAVLDLGQVAVLKRGSIVKGTIVKVEDQQVFVDVGYKFEGVIPLRELSAVSVEKASDVVAVGQEVECRVQNIDDAKETLVLSKRAVDSINAWERLQQLYESGEVFEAKVADVVKGGLVVDVGVRGFIPASMVERHFVEDFSDYKGRTLRLIVKELDREANRVILSQKDVLDAEYEAKKRERMNELNPGDILEGTVQRLTNFGAFVDVGGVDGLVHVSEIDWVHVDKPSDVLKEGDKVKVKVLKVNPEQGRISLSIKQAGPGPWEQVSGKFNVGDIVTGTVKRLASFGAFVEIMPGVEGLVHISQIAHRHIGTPHEVLKEGQQVNVKILDINPAEKRVSLSIKETEEPPAAPERPSRREARSSSNIPDEYSGEGLSITLGERFGDQLSKLK